MQYLDLLQSSGDCYIKISHDVLAVFAKYAQITQGSPESGGILLGYVRGESLEIIEATVPYSNDERNRFFFLRRPKGHQEIADRRWSESQGLIRYLGEWHTHPQDHPSPSFLDRAEWKKSAKRRKDNRPQLGLIVGRYSLYAELMHSNGIGSVFNSL